MPATARNTLGSPHPSRRKMLAAIHIQWKQLRPDLHHSEDEMRDERLAFITDTLKLRRPLESLSDLTDRQLGLVLDAFKGLRAQPALPNCEAKVNTAMSPVCKFPRPVAATPESGGAEVIHTASIEQIYTIHKLLNYLGWTTEFQKSFIKQRFKRDSPTFLRPKQAHSLIRILMNIACSRDLKEQGVVKASAALIRAQIPALKQRLGIDRKETEGES